MVERSIHVARREQYDLGSIIGAGVVPDLLTGNLAHKTPSLLLSHEWLLSIPDEIRPA
ncbi:MAG TPA: hypothetical protein VL854_09735 [Nitrososphaeraceae archaeon]|nr:hypothetical protein [Nitrososphaeraceae archaeon]